MLKYWFRAYCERLLLLFLAVVYITERSPEPALGDSLSFSVAALQGFDYSTNATNHFLYINLMHLLSLITGFKYSHLAFQLLSLIPSILTLVMLSKILKQLRIEPTIRFLGMFLLGFSFTYWRHAEIIEVYALNLLITSFAIYWFVLWHGNRRRKYLYYSSFILGLAMLLHVQQVLYIPFLMYWCFLAFSFNFKHWLKTFLLFALPASFLFVPPIVFNTNTIESIFFDNSFQDQVLGLNVQTILKGIVKSVGLLIFNFGPLAALLILAAFKVKTEKTLHWGLFVMGIVVYGFAARYNVTDNYVFFLPAYLVLIILFSLFANQVAIKSKTKSLLIFGMALGMPIFYSIAPFVASKTSFGIQMNQDKAYKGGASFYFYPGMRSNNGGLWLGNKIKQQHIKPDLNLEIEQNANNALKYLEYWQQAHH